jgi:hypothetical protein
VLKQLETMNPKNEKGSRKHKHHQWLTEDISNPALNRHLWNVITLMKASANYPSFYRLLQRALPKQGDTLSLPLDYSEDNK